MIINDAHFHIGNYYRVKKILEHSQYITKYKLYNAINPQTIALQEEYIHKINNFFAIPIIFKEIDIQDENNFTNQFCISHGKGIPVILIDDNNFFEESKYTYALMKEHFLLHNFNDFQSRSLYYNYLNEQKGYLILHCRDDIRIFYIDKLRCMYPNMNIIVAHLGRNTIENYNDIEKLLLNFKFDNNILFDISTIANIEIILRALDIVGEERILYGSDFPYDFDFIKEQERIGKLKEIFIKEQQILKKIGEENFEKVRCLSRVK